MRVIVVGLGTQGQKRRRFAGDDYVASVDPFNSEARYRSIEDVPLESFDAALCCTPDDPKYQLLRYLLLNGKDVLVEKPLGFSEPQAISEIEDLARSQNLICYTAYNHRFEPHFVRMRDLIASGELGRLYTCRLFYGNGTARLVRTSRWRDEGAGVLPDLGSHLLDTCRFWFDDFDEDFRVTSSNAFENAAPDHVVIGSDGRMTVELEMTLLSWRNSFTCDILAEQGSAHISSLCKWGPSKFIHRRRVLPSGTPSESQIVLIQDDPTWMAEYEHFKHLCKERAPVDLANDLWLTSTLSHLCRQIIPRS